eukprot:6192810-Pleurochrysis_carterae.AAC.2
MELYIMLLELHNTEFNPECLVNADGNVRSDKLLGWIGFILGLMGGSKEVRKASLVLLEKLQPQMLPHFQQQSETAFNVFEEIKGKYQKLSSAKVERRMLSQLLAPRVEQLDMMATELRETDFQLECLRQAGCTVASVYGGAKEPNWDALLVAGFLAEVREVGWSGMGCVGTLEGHSKGVASVRMTPDGARRSDDFVCRDGARAAPSRRPASAHAQTRHSAVCLAACGGRLDHMPGLGEGSSFYALMAMPQFIALFRY